MQTKHTAENTEASAVLVASILKNLDTLIDHSRDRRIEFDRFYFGARKLTNEERDYAMKTHFELKKELSTYSKILLDLLSLEKINKENV
jgi:hypothetical protein